MRHCGIAFSFALTVLFAASSAQATGHPDDYVPPVVKAVKTEPIRVVWQDPANAPGLLVWMDNGKTYTPERVTSSGNAMLLSRPGLTPLPDRLLVVPQNDALKPVILTVTPDVKEIALSFEPVAPDEIWLWGITPANRCGNFGPSLLISIGRTDDDQTYQQSSGPFLWHMTRTGEQSYAVAVNFGAEGGGSPKVQSVVVDGFSKANDIVNAVCSARGIDCSSALEARRGSWGHSHEVKFGTGEFNWGDCPV